MTNLTILTCPECLSEYILGVTGTTLGCDACWGIERNPVDHTIIDSNVMDDKTQEAEA